LEEKHSSFLAFWLSALGNKNLILLEQKHSSLQAFSLLAFGKNNFIWMAFKSKASVLLSFFLQSSLDHNMDL
jgi:hypothetical protein